MWAIIPISLRKKNLTYSSIFKVYFMKSFAAAKASFAFIKNRCRSSHLQMFFKIGVIKNFAMFTGKHLWCRPSGVFLWILQNAKSSFLIEHLRWLLLQMFCLTLYFQIDVAEYIVVLHCIIVSLWNLKSLSFAFICCTTRCHSLNHSLSLVVPLVVLLVATRFHSLYHSLSLAVTCFHSLSLVVPLVVTRCTARCHSFSLDVRLVCLFINDSN